MPSKLRQTMCTWSTQEAREVSPQANYKGSKTVGRFKISVKVLDKKAIWPKARCFSRKSGEQSAGSSTETSTRPASSSSPLTPAMTLERPSRSEAEPSVEPKTPRRSSAGRGCRSCRPSGRRPSAKKCR